MIYLLIFDCILLSCEAKIKKTVLKNNVQRDEPIKTTEATDYEDSENGDDDTDYPDENKKGRYFEMIYFFIFNFMNHLIVLLSVS